MAITRCGVLTYSASGSRYDDLLRGCELGAHIHAPGHG